MADTEDVYVTVVIKSTRAVRALRRVRRALESICEDQPWNEEAETALRAFRFAVKRIELEVD